MRRFTSFLKTHGKTALLFLLSAATICVLLGYHLGSLTNGVSANEVAMLQHYSSFHAILHNPLDAPYKLLAWALWHIPLHSAAWLRLPSAIFGVTALITFSFIVRRWHGFRAAMFGILLFATSSWLLHTSRLTSYDVEYLWGMTTLIALHLILHLYSENFIARLSWCIGMAVLLFIPGFIWLVGFNIIIQRHDLADAWADTSSAHRMTFTAIWTLCLAALAVVFYFHPQLILTWLGAPAEFADWQEISKRFGNAFAYFVVRGPHNPALWLGQLPVLDAFVSAMLIAGIIFYAKHLVAPRTRLLLGLFLITAVLFALNPAINFGALVPVAYLVAVAGIAYVLHEWLKVFPRNPLARGIGIGLMLVVTLAACGYNLRSYFVAWPGSPDTKAVMTETFPRE